ncbi:MAG TPA: hypothetical protein VFX52_11390 [Nocardioidaceae bacterium]|nr:hypothetical protein [Nocardioidaceae bacterium]
MSPLSAPVLLIAALVSGPALWGAFVDGSTSLQTALVRFLVCAVLGWVGLSVVSMLVGPAPRRPGERDEAEREPSASKTSEPSSF